MAGSIALDSATGKQALGCGHRRPDQALHHHRRAARGEGQGADRQRRRRTRRARLHLGLRRRHRQAGVALLHRARQSRGWPGQGRLRQRTGDGRAATWNGQYWKIGGGGTVWDSMAYDPGLDLLYIGVGNGSPWNRSMRSAGKGDNLFLSSIVALKPDTGEYVWHYQTTTGESWDHTATQQIIIADLTIDGAQAPGADAGAEERLLLRDRRRHRQADLGEELHRCLLGHRCGSEHRPASREPGDARYNSHRQALPVDSRIPNGAHTWHSMAFSPQTGLVYLPIHGTPFVYGKPTELQAAPMATNVGADFSGNAALDPKDVLAEDLRPPDRLGSGEPEGSLARGARWLRPMAVRWPRPAAWCSRARVPVHLHRTGCGQRQASCGLRPTQTGVHRRADDLRASTASSTWP